MFNEYDGMKFWHIGIYVKDMDKALAFYDSLPGERNWTRKEINTPDEKTIFGGGYHIISVKGYVGGVLYELIQPLDTTSMQAKVLAEKGECISHVAYLLGDHFDEVTTDLINKGNVVLSQAEMPDERHTRIWFIQAKDGGMVFELLDSDEVPFSKKN